MRELSEQYGVPVLPVAAALLAVSAAEVGGGLGCAIPGRHVPLQFNLLLATEKPARRLPWLDEIAAPARAAFLRLSRSSPQKAVERAQDVAAGERSGLDEESLRRLRLMEAETWAAARPVITFDDPSPPLLTLAVLNSFDHSVLLLDGGQGILSALRHSSARERRMFGRMLSQSWDGEFRVFRRNERLEGRIHLVSSANVTDLQHPGMLPLFLSGVGSLPVLTLTLEENGRALPISVIRSGAIQADFSAWARTLRLSGRRVVFHTNEEGNKVINQFAERIAAASLRISQELAPALSWTPELVIRLGALVEILNSRDAIKTNHLVPAKTLEEVTTHLLKPLVNAHWQSVSRIWGRQPRQARGTALTDTELKIFLRIAQRPGVTARELQRSFNTMTKDARDQALARLFKEGWVRSDPQGKLEVRHSSVIVDGGVRRREVEGA